MRPLVVDTSVWVEWIRGQRGELRSHLRDRLVLMPAVVSMELLSGTRKRRAARAVATLLRPFLRHRRIILPAYADYALAGELLAELGWASSVRGNDALIAVSARKVGAALLTLNHGDFQPLCSRLRIPSIDSP